MKKHTNPNCQCISCKSHRGEIFGKKAGGFKDGHCINKRCEDCGKKIHPQATTCEPCYYLRKKESQKGINNSNFKNGITLTQYFCKCGNKISLNNYLYGKKHCLKCYLKTIKGKTHPNWQGGISKYGYSYLFNLELKEIIRKRDNYTCQKCHKKGNTVHHIDYNKENCKENNLITLCLSCNFKVNYNRKFWIKYFIKDNLSKNKY